MGILANHVPSVEALKAGVVEVIEDAGSQSKKWFSKSRLLGVVEGKWNKRSVVGVLRGHGRELWNTMTRVQLAGQDSLSTSLAIYITGVT